MSRFGSELRRRRESAGLSLTAFAEVAHFTKGYLSKVENGRARPNRGLAEICDQVLGAGGELAALVADEPPAPGTVGLLGLPTGSRYFVGRAAELARLAAALRRPDGPTVCVVDGMAGVGKTALAVAAAWAVEHDFTDGCVFLDLHGYTPQMPHLTGSDCLDRLLRLLDVPGERIPPDLDGRANLFRDRLHGRRMLLVLDNARASVQVQPLLPAERRCRVLVTSRRRLVALDEAEHVSLGTLQLAEAATLFRAVAEPERPAGSDGVERIVELCGGLPLVVRIVAAKLRHGGFTADELWDRLTDEATRLVAMDDGERSVVAAFRLSVEHLPADQQVLFGLLALVPAGADAAALAALAGRSIADTERLLGRLHDAHLVIRQPGGSVELHDLVRAFAMHYVLPGLPAADRHAAVCRLVEHVVARLAAADMLLDPERYRPDLALPELPEVWSDNPDWDCARAQGWLRAQWPTLVRVVELAATEGLPERCWQAALLLRGFFSGEKLLEPWLATHLLALVAARETGSPKAVGMTLNNLGMAHLERGELDEAADCHRLACSAFDEAADGYGRTDALSCLAWVRYYRDEPAQALHDLAAALDAYRYADRARNAAITLRGMALAATALERFEEGLDYAEQALRSAPSARDTVMAVNCLAWVLFRRGDDDGAHHRYAEAAALARRQGPPDELARALTGLGNIAASRGNPDQAGQCWAVADEVPVLLSTLLFGEARYRQDATAG